MVRGVAAEATTLLAHARVLDSRPPRKGELREAEVKREAYRNLELCVDAGLPVPRALLALIAHLLNITDVDEDGELQNWQDMPIRRNTVRAWRKAVQYEATYPPDPKGRNPSKATKYMTAKKANTDKANIRLWRTTPEYWSAIAAEREDLARALRHQQKG